MNKKTLVLFAICLCILLGSIGGVFAFLSDNTDPLSNEFIPAKVSCSVEEVFANGVKENVQVKNTGNIDAYIRATVVINFVSAEGKIMATAPIENQDYTISYASSDWIKGSDGYWYHKKAVAPDTLTASLIKTATALNAPNGYSLNVQIIASAIQSAPDSAVTEAWGVSVSNGVIIPN